MPGGDRTGPVGYGPLTGRGAGFCAGFPAPGYGNPPSFCGGRRGGSRMRWWTHLHPQWTESPPPKYYASRPPFNEKEYLEDQVQYLKDELLEMESRLQKMKEED